MKKALLLLTLFGGLTLITLNANEATPHEKVNVKQMTPTEVYERMSQVLANTWSLSPKEKQIDTTGAHKNKAIAHLVGTNEIGTEYKVIGRGATLEEILLPDTTKSMVTMYHCDSYKNCTEMKATHYCAKQNQPQFLLNLEKTSENKFVFDCDMRTKLCNSAEDHIHQIVLELSEEENHLKASYLAWKDKKLRNKHSIYHFDRRKNK